MELFVAYKNNFLFTIGEDKKLVQYNLNNLKKQFWVLDHTKKINAIVIANDD